MAKKSILEREIKKRTLVLKYFLKRKTLLLQVKRSKNLEDFFLASQQLQKLPRNSSVVRLRNRCWKTGRSRGFTRMFGLCRNIIYEFGHQGFLPGLIKASW